MNFTRLLAAVAVGLFVSPVLAQQAAIVSKPVAEKKVTELPSAPLFWRIENFPTLSEAQAAARNHSLAVEAFGKAWLFTLGRQSEASPGGTKVTEVGPLPEVRAPQYLLRVNEG